jgi:phospholipase A-2-activating protein
VAFVPSSSAYPDGLIVSGGKDAIIEVRQPGRLPDDNAEALLLGHAGNVCTLDTSDDGQVIVSGSWDTEARVWQVGKWESSVVLKGHTASVWAVAVYNKETILTGESSGRGGLRVPLCYLIANTKLAHRQRGQAHPRLSSLWQANT